MTYTQGQELWILDSLSWWGSTAASYPQRVDFRYCEAFSNMQEVWIFLLNCELLPPASQCQVSWLVLVSKRPYPLYLDPCPLHPQLYDPGHNIHTLNSPITRVEALLVKHTAQLRQLLVRLMCYKSLPVQQIGWCIAHLGVMAAQWKPEERHSRVCTALDAACSKQDWIFPFAWKNLPVLNQGARKHCHQWAQTMTLPHHQGIPPPQSHFLHRRPSTVNTQEPYTQMF